MSLSLIVALTICPAMLGIQEAIRDGQAKNRREKRRSQRCNLVVSCVKRSIRSRDIDNRLIVLKDNKLYIDSDALIDDPERSFKRDLHPFTGYFLPYPDASYEGIVTTIADDPPVLNWVYVDKDTHQVKYGVRADAQPHLTGPFDWTSQDRRLSLDGWEGFVAVEEDPGVWALYFDRDDDGLRGKVPFGVRVLEIELTRREKKAAKPEPPADGDDDAQPVTLEQEFEKLQKQDSEGAAGQDQPPVDDRDANGTDDAGEVLRDSLRRLSLNPYDILDAYRSSLSSSGEDGGGGGDPQSPSADGESEYVTLAKQTPVPGLDIEIGTRRPAKHVTFDTRQRPKFDTRQAAPFDTGRQRPQSPTASATSAPASTWSAKAGTRSTPASSVHEEDGNGAASDAPRPSGRGGDRGPRGGYRKPQVEDEDDEAPAYVSEWLGSGSAARRKQARAGAY